MWRPLFNLLLTFGREQAGVLFNPNAWYLQRSSSAQWRHTWIYSHPSSIVERSTSLWNLGGHSMRPFLPETTHLQCLLPQCVFYTILIPSGCWTCCKSGITDATKMNGVTISEETNDIYTASADRLPSSERRLVCTIRVSFHDDTANSPT